MAIIRSPRPENHFTVIENQVLRDERLSYKARGILIYILSHIDNWRISADDLADKSTDGRTAVLSGLEELRTLGYIITTRKQGADGKWTTESVVFDTPQRLPKSGFPTSVYPTSENPTPLEEPSKNNHKYGEPNGSQVRELMKLYFENYTGDLVMDRGQAAGQIMSALKQTTMEKLAPLVKQVAIEGQVLSRNTLIQAGKRLNVKPTPQSAEFDREEYEQMRAKAVPMPKNFKELMKQAMEASRMPD